MSAPCSGVVGPEKVPKTAWPSVRSAARAEASVAAEVATSAGASVVASAPSTAPLLSPDCSGAEHPARTRAAATSAVTECDGMSIGVCVLIEDIEYGRGRGGVFGTRPSLAFGPGRRQWPGAGCLPHLVPPGKDAYFFARDRHVDETVTLYTKEKQQW